MRTQRHKQASGGTGVFGPVPSRRLGRSLGINTLPGKTCTYNCLYCQAGRTTDCSLKRRVFQDPAQLLDSVTRKIKYLSSEGVPIDYLSFVANGEPTLDRALGEEIRLLRPCGIRIAVFTNASLLWKDDVKEALLLADYVSVKIDTVQEATWRKINRPHGQLSLPAILDGIAEFARAFRGVLTTETMLVKNVNGSTGEVRAVGDFLSSLKRGTSYFAIPVRPPAELSALPPDPHTLAELSRLVQEAIAHSAMLSSPEGGEFSGGESVEEELLGILSVHPMNEESVGRFLRRKGGGTVVLGEMIRKQSIQMVEFGGKRFYVRNHGGN